MKLNIAVPPLAPLRAGRVNPMIVIRIALAVAALFFLLGHAFAEPLRLRAEVTTESDVLTLADLVEGAAGAAAATPVFRAPAPGESGTIQARRVAEAAARLGLAIEAGTGQVTVTRAARRIGAHEIESALKHALELRHGVDARALSLVHDGAPPSLTVAANATAPVTMDEVSYDRRSRRVSALAFVGADRRAVLRIAGTVTELVEAAVLTRALNRGETVQVSDFAVERRAKETLPGDVQPDASALVGRVARRALSAGAVVRAGDLGRPEVVARGDVVTVFYEIPGMTLTLRARATEAGAQGDTIGVLNIQSKKTLQATVVAPGRVAVSAATPGPLAGAATADVAVAAAAAAATPTATP